MKKTIRDIDLKNKKVLIRVDFNVPLNSSQEITDDNRIKASLPTIQYALDQGASRVILMSHLGRPKGSPNPSMSLKPAALRLQELLGRAVVQAEDCIGEKASSAVDSAPAGAVVLLENLRFYSQEEKNEADFAAQLASLADVYVNDAFGTSHRAHASVAGITKNLLSASGFLLEKEIKYLGETLKNPEKPFVVILGGAKVSDKIALIENMIEKVDRIIIGGAMAFTFLKAKGVNVGKSRVENDKLDVAQDILNKAEKHSVEILLPEDNIVVQEFNEDAEYKVSENGMEDAWEGVDIGPKTAKRYAESLKDASTVVWNGPMGVFEMKNFKQGSLEVAKVLAENKDCTTIIGGGDTAACVIQFGLADQMTHISTGGGASLEYLEGKTLPGIESLADQEAAGQTS